MFGYCPVCKKKLEKKELTHLKEGAAARCFGCGKLYINHPLYVILLFALMILLPFCITYLNTKVLVISCMLLIFIIVAFYYEIKIRLPLIEEK
jgi:protein-S-isoprenylcysteine O-methyltransferase Ste14